MCLLLVFAETGTYNLLNWLCLPDLLKVSNQEQLLRLCIRHCGLSVLLLRVI